jgi:oligopeptide/dipeptide ABC transporter ATP-binding protein
VILSVRDLRVSFGPLRAVDGLSFDIDEGEIFVIIGESGSGKSLTGMSVLGLLPPRAAAGGSIRFEDREILGLGEPELRKLRGAKIGVVYQDPLSAMNPVWPVGEQIAETLRSHGVADRRGAARRAVELLERVHMPDPARVARAFPHEISGGMRQRAMIAMALACGPRLLIADEPTTALDVTIKAQVLDLLKELRRDFALTIVLITHDMGVVAEMADRVIVMYAGKIVEHGTVREIFHRPQHPYTWGLLGSIARLDRPKPERLNAIPGSPPSLTRLPAGCAFAERCAFRFDKCAEVPRLHDRVGNGHLDACHLPAEEKRQHREELALYSEGLPETLTAGEEA